ncbi:CPBP family intramembrane glutamic endopeptidase [Clostridium felsineum]|uniref:CAAX prenyl protease 2/Lysostaphin resistance protein A-like domain-containing protein n=1 Tax=Clostridium felsineum TaxID=36839 RepID=A0A1S8MBP4_9CLOT|nr:type II CAAX endopeptidase family protein [Clostridium felsineum]URZ08969.1 hypothetical protein CLROS_043730 [Clostridium felsineum]URZ09597.1 hypothetical protein CROST_002780 [Clostridium felsineum]
MKKFHWLFIFIFFIISGLLLSFKIEYLKEIGLETLFLSIGLFIIFILNHKNILLPTNLRNINRTTILYILALSFLATLLTTYILCLFSYFNIGYFNYSKDSNKITLIEILITLLFSPICEEILFRAGLLSLLIKKIPLHLSILIQGIIFAFLHGLSFKTITFYTALVGGIILGYIFYYTRSVIASILCHFMYNLMGLFIGILVFKITTLFTLVFCIFLCLLCLLIIFFCIQEIKSSSKPLSSH